MFTNHIHIIETEVTTENAKLLQKIKGLIDAGKTILIAPSPPISLTFLTI